MVFCMDFYQEPSVSNLLLPSITVKLISKTFPQLYSHSRCYSRVHHSLCCVYLCPLYHGSTIWHSLGACTPGSVVRDGLTVRCACGLPPVQLSWADSGSVSAEVTLLLMVKLSPNTMWKVQGLFENSANPGGLIFSYSLLSELLLPLN